MTFILRIFFMGLVAFVPSRDGKELTVLLVETRAEDAASDGSAIPLHHPMLLARASQCQGHCGIDAEIDPVLLFPKNGAAAGRYLAAALDHGAAWTLAGSDLSIVDAGSQGSQTGDGLEMNLSQVADLGQIAPGAGVVKSDLLACRPSENLIVARLRLRSGNVGAYRVVPAVDFKPLLGNHPAVGSSRDLADWVVAEIKVAGDSVEIVENRFGREAIRTLRLAPANGFVELAVMNIPDPPAPQPEAAFHPEHQADTHFELYYKLAQTPPPAGQRPVPHATKTQEAAILAKAPRSELLEGLMLGDPKGFYERIICPVARLSESQAP